MRVGDYTIEFKSVCAICFTFLLTVLMVGYYSTKNNEITSEKEIVETKLETAAEVEVREESEQFWQKLVPWGEDEEETGK